MDIDVKKIMLVLLERQKEYVREDLNNYSYAMIAAFTADGKSYIQFPKFQNEREKIAAYSSIVAEAKAKRALVIITVNHARVGSLEMAANIENYRWGDYDETNSRPCILLTASGPGMDSSSLTLDYSIADGEVRFGTEEWLSQVELNLLPDWPDISATAVH